MFYQTADLLKHYIHVFMTFRVDQKLRFIFIIANGVTPEFFKTGIAEVIVDIPSRLRGQLMCERTRIFLTSQVINTCFFSTRPALSVQH